MGSHCWRASSRGISLAVRLTPKSASDAITGVGTLADGGEVLLVRVRALPSGGNANQALLRILSDFFGVPKSKVRLLTGGASRQKRVEIEGDADDLAGAIERLKGQNVP